MTLGMGRDVRFMDGLILGRRHTRERDRHENFVHTWRNPDSDVPFEWYTDEDIQPIVERISGNTVFRYITLDLRGCLVNEFREFLDWLMANVLQGKKLQAFRVNWLRDGVIVNAAELRDIFGDYFCTPGTRNVRKN